jgi:ATP-dependent helicase IRC3
MAVAGPVLRDYQRACLDAILDRYRAGVRRQLVCLPTGTGKTVVFSQFPGFFRMRHRMLVLAHREELLEQARDKLVRADPGLRVGIEQASRHAPDDCEVVVASVATLGRTDSARVRRLRTEDFNLCVVDEAHHATAPTYVRILEHFGFLEPGTRKLVVGFTATPKRGDGQGLDAVFQEITFARSLREMVQAGYLVPPVGYRVETDVDLTGVKTKMGDFVTAQLSHAVNTDARNDTVVKVYMRLLPDAPALCFCVDVEHAKRVATAFEDAGIAAGAVTGELERAERARLLAAFHAGEVRVLTTCMVLTEGYDEPTVRGILLARPTRSALLYTQMIGRGTRLHPGKDNVTVVDIVDVTKEHHLVTLPTLFGLPSQLDLQGRTAMAVERAFAWVERNRPWVSTDAVRSLDELRYRCQRIDLLDLETPPEIEELVDYAWVRTGQGGYRLHLAGGEHIEVTPTILDDWEAVLCSRSRPRFLFRERDEHSVFRAAERFVARERPDSVALVARSGAWREASATEKQLHVLRAKHIEAPRRLTRGQASHVIAMLASASASRISPPAAADGSGAQRARQ